MRPGLLPDNPLERMAIRMNLAPVPDGHAMFGMPMSRVTIAGVRMGVFERLARGPATVEEVARDIGAHAEGTRLLLESLAALDQVERERGTYSLSRTGRKWLDPASDTYVGTHVENCLDYWEWWARLEDVIRTGRGVEIHDFAPDDPHWRRYIRGQFELARLSAPEVAGALRLPPGPRRLLDVAGGHGWFAAELCRRHPELHATVLDLPPSAAVGREIIAEQGMADRVTHVEGDMMSADLGGPYDGALCFNIVHHLPPNGNVELLRRIRAALSPGGTIAVLDLFMPPPDTRADAGAMLGLFFYLTSSAATYTEDQLRDWLVQAGFDRPRRVKLRRLPNLTLFEARRSS
jgi:2-polyprenyl-3-methyl-5-hydroxy-6-metoxy-1,4-benzoquinol methylase